MLKNFLMFVGILLLPVTAWATPDYDESKLFESEHSPTPCATPIFNRALANTANMIADADVADSEDIDAWAHVAFSKADVLNAVLNCDEVKDKPDDETILFDTVTYTFPNGRKIEINYETQKKVLIQKLKLANKPKLGNGDISPDIYDDVLKGSVWTNVDPAWYGILVAEHGSLDEFIHPNKVNLVSLRYIEDNIGKLYPQDHSGPYRANCTSKTAWAEDTDMINVATLRTVGAGPEHKPQTKEEKEQKDQVESNDFYVLGDADLSWVMYAEIATDIVLTVVTTGGYVAVKGSLTAARATKSFAKATKIMKELRGSENVAKWVKTSSRARDVEKAITTAGKADKVADSYRTISGVEKTAAQTVKNLNKELDALKTAKADPKKIKAVEQELEFATKQADTAKDAAETAKKLEKAEKELSEIKDVDPEKAKKLEQEISGLKNTYSKQLTEVKNAHAKELEILEKTDDVKSYKEVAEARRELAHTAYLMRQGKRASNRGLLPVRAFKAAKSLRQGFKSAKELKKATKVVRTHTSGFAARVNDWLFHSTLKNITRISKVPATLNALVMVVKIAGDMYDKTDTSTGDFTNNIDMKPYLLLGADNLPEYENVVNYGMWMFWAGSSTSAQDDDAAYLQAMDFAEKFHQDLVETQDEYNVMACDVDIYVVRPVIRNPGTDNEELYYLFMNDVPWTTNGFNTPNDGTGETSIPLRNETATQDA